MGEPQGRRSLGMVFGLLVDLGQEIVKKRAGIAMGDVRSLEAGALLGVVLSVEGHREDIGLVPREVLGEVDLGLSSHRGSDDVQVVQVEGRVDVVLGLFALGGLEGPLPCCQSVDEVLRIDLFQNLTGGLANLRTRIHRIDVIREFLAVLVLLVSLVVRVRLVLVEVQRLGVGLNGA